MARIGPHSRPGRLALIDGRKAEAQFMKRIRDELTAHVGGRPSATQRMIIDRCAALSLRIHLMDRAEARNDAFMSEKNAREYLCWTAALSRLLRQLGLEEAPANDKPLSVAEMMRASSQPSAA
jgi:hypothetical protein